MGALTTKFSTTFKRISSQLPARKQTAKFFHKQFLPLLLRGYQEWFFKNKTMKTLKKITTILLFTLVLATDIIIKLVLITTL